MSGQACAEEELDCRQARASIKAYETSLRAGDYDGDRGQRFRKRISDLIGEFNFELNKLTRKYTKEGE